MNILSGKNPTIGAFMNNGEMNFSITYDATIEHNGKLEEAVITVNNIDPCAVGMMRDEEVEYATDKRTGVKLFGIQKNTPAFIRFRMLPNSNNELFSYTIKKEVKKNCKTCVYMGVDVSCKPCSSCIEVESNRPLWEAKK